MSLKFETARELLHDFKLRELFVEELGWSNPARERSDSLEIEGQIYSRTRIAEMSGVPIFEVVAADGEIPIANIQLEIYKQIAEQFAENLLIFLNGSRTRSVWFWAKREGAKVSPRIETYVQGQPADLLLSKVGALWIGAAELESGNPPVVLIADRLQQSFDVEKVTKQFYKDFQEVHLEFVTQYVQGIGNEADRRWYTSVLLNRLMFVYFLQKKGFLVSEGDRPLFYLQDQLERRRGENCFLKGFLQPLFFEGFAKSEPRSPEIAALIGQVPYLNGGLFLEHPIEQKYPQAEISDAAFERIFGVFQKYSWHLDDRAGGKPNEINPDVLGYIFEKYINQKAFGAYYTRPEITEYLCDRTINKLILDRVNRVSERQFGSIGDLLVKLDARLCRLLIFGDEAILKTLALLDPACGSGAFLIAAMKTLIPIYNSVIGTIMGSSDDPQLSKWLKTESEGRSLAYLIKKRIITDNLYGVDIMEEATEIAKLRLFLALVSSAREAKDLEPLPNIDFNIMVGNSLIGLMRVDEDSFNRLDPAAGAIDPVQKNLLQPVAVQGSLLPMFAANQYRSILEEKNRNIALYKKHSFLRVDAGGTDQDDRLEALRNEINKLNRESEQKLNQLLLDEFSQRLGIKYEQAQLTGKAKKRLLTLADMAALKPFHWGYHFDQVMARGGFDAIITNPPWEAFKPNAREFFVQHNELVIKSKMDIKQFEKAQQIILEDPEVAETWLEYQSQYPYVSSYYRSTEQYKNQISIVNGKKAGTDINLYKLFLEQCFNLLRPGGCCGIILPTGIYTDLGAKQLREMLFSQTSITDLFGLSNERFIFDAVDHRFKICLLTLEKGKSTQTFQAAFRITTQEAIRPEQLDTFLNNRDEQIEIDVSLIRKLSPDSLSVMEFKSNADIEIAQKMLKFPLLGKQIADKWNLRLTAEFHMTSDSHLFQQKSNEEQLPLYEGKMIHQFTHQFAEPRYWLSESAARESLLGRNKDNGQKLAYQRHRLGFRAIARATDIRTLIVGSIPKNVFCGNSILVSSAIGSYSELLVAQATLNSFVLDFYARQMVSSNINMFYIYQLPVPRLVEGDRYFNEIVDRAAKLICTTPEFDDLAAEVGLGSHTSGITDETERAKLRAELDGIIAHLYGLTETEFTHILSTFPIVPAETKKAAIDAYHYFIPTVGDTEILALIAQGESAQLEFKSTARWNLKEAKKDPIMEDVILKTVAGFLNTQGGTLLIGVADNGDILGLQSDYKTLQKKNRDGYELWLTNFLLQAIQRDLAQSIALHFHTIDQQEICEVRVQRSPRPVFIDLRDKSGQLQECFFIRSGNATLKLDKPSEITHYTKTHWA